MEDKDAIEREKALSIYTCVIDVHSLQGFPEGWEIYGDDTFDKDRNGRVIAVVGEYKSGKTFITGLIIGKTAPHHQTINTPGLGVILPKDSIIEDSDKKSEAPKSKAAIFKNRGNTRLTDVIQPKNQTVHHIIIDTEGTDIATPEYRMQDEKAKEIFLRHVQLELADKFIFVTSKFNSKTQWSIRKLINQLSYKDKKKVTENNRLFVIHNLMDVQDKELYQKRIQEVANCYWNPELPIEDTFTPMTREITFQKNSYTFTYYQTTETFHLFMVRHPDNPSEGDWCFTHNTSCIEVIKQLLVNTNPRKFNLLKEFIQNANTLFVKYGYIRGWDQTYAIKYQPEQKAIVPVRVKPTNVESLGNQIYSKDDDFTDGQVVEEVELSGMQITDIGEVITEGQSKLNGNVFTNKEHHIITIFTPGISDLKQINMTFRGWTGITISIKLPDTVDEKDKINGQTPDYARKELHTGTAIFIHHFADVEPFERPKDLKEVCMLNHGILTVRLKRENYDA